MLSLWPTGFLAPAQYAEQWNRLRPAFIERVQSHGIPLELADELAGIYLPLAAWVHGQMENRPLVIGVNGAQGSGKSTLCEFLGFVLDAAYGWRVAGFSIDDLYKTRAERERLAREVHPLFITRGVPGTHDVDLGIATIRALKSAGPYTLTALPAFDKARDDRRPSVDWPVFRGRPHVILFEGWCVGTAPQSEAALAKPVNGLEESEDPEGIWRRHVNEQLEGPYAELFGELARLILLRVPGMDRVFEWRALQERKLREKTDRERPHRLMDEAGIRRFIQHYERLTRHNLEDLPKRADLVLDLDDRHRFTQVHIAGRRDSQEYSSLTTHHSSLITSTAL